MTTMKKPLFKVATLLATTICFTSCSRTTVMRKNYLSGNYVLSYAISIKPSTPLGEPYIKLIKKIDDCNSYFDFDSSFFNFHVKVVDGKAVGYGDYLIKSKTTLFEQKEGTFEYYCDYTNVYGNSLVMSEETKADYFGRQQYRRNNWWFRTEISIPEVTRDIILLEFTFKEAFDSPEEFNHHLW